MENLNKQNYFTQEWTEKFPKASKLFCDWIDEYKKSVSWSTLFNELVHTPAPKFHEIPLEFQNGVIHKFFLSNGYCIDLENTVDKMIDCCNTYFNELENFSCI